MPLDPLIKQWLDADAAQPGPDFTSLAPADIRIALDAANMRRMTTEHVAVARVEDAAAPGPRGDIPLRIYTPTVHGSMKTLPMTVFFHGGGFVVGSIANYDMLCRVLCRESKSLVVSVDYRLAPEYPFPAGPDDCLAALRFIASHGETWGGDTARIAVAGDSAGGGLAAITALRAREEGGPALKGQCLIYPMVDFSRDGLPSVAENAQGYGFTRPARDWYIDQYLGDDSERDHPFNTLLTRDDLAGLPPALVISAEYDPLRDEGERLAERLAQAGVPTVSTRYFGMIHGFMRRAGQHPQADQLMAQCGNWLRRALKAD
ncbi:alpha/beta hydrolase [Phytohalomonas tamaricis]|uniref:alpha/beta hydrolase n=1 Tax=Phytohalomonas tamaricis TaxID=2081032 RepID=UPI000D0B2274|nr:alpha/beta hydrolase [Phytohalomonas tamaricis]